MEQLVATLNVKHEFLDILVRYNFTNYHVLVSLSEIIIFFFGYAPQLIVFTYFPTIFLHFTELPKTAIVAPDYLVMMKYCEPKTSFFFLSLFFLIVIFR